MPDQTEKLRLVAVIEGFEEAARKATKIVEAQRALQEQVKELGRTIRDTTKGRRDEVESIDQVTDAQARLQKQTEEVSKSEKEAAREVARLHEQVKELSAKLDKEGQRPRFAVTERHVELVDSMTKVAIALGIAIAGGLRLRRIFRRLDRGVSSLGKSFFGLKAAILSSAGALQVLGAVGSILASMARIRSAIKAEIEDRLRLIEVMKIQSRAADETVNKQLSLQQELERVANRRRQGGFAGPDVSRRVRGAAETTQQQFTQLMPGEITQALGTFGDVPGVTQEQLSSLAIIASMGGFADLGRVEGLPPGKQMDWLLKRYQGRVERYAGTETVQGEGRGWGRYRPAVTERAQRAMAEARAVGGAKTTLRARLAEILPPQFATVLPGEDESGIDKLVRIYEQEQSAAAMEARRLSTISRSPFSSLWQRVLGRVGVGMRDQPGYWAQIREAATFPKVEMFLKEDWEMGLEGLEKIEREAGFGEGRPRDELGEIKRAFGDWFSQVGRMGAMSGSTIINMQHSRHLYPDARSQQQAINNGQNRSRLREAG